jgi:hypothetical protein
MAGDKQPRRPSRARAPKGADPLEESKRNQAVFAQYLENILLDPRSPVWDRILDHLATHGSRRVAEAVVSGIRLGDATRAELARALLRDSVEALGLEPELLARLGNAINDPRVVQLRTEKLPTRDAEQEFKRTAGRLVRPGTEAD